MLQKKELIKSLEDQQQNVIKWWHEVRNGPNFGHQN